LLQKGHDHWAGYYSRVLVKEKLSHQQVYLMSVANQKVGTVTLDTNQVDYYTLDDLAHFENPRAPSIYVTALAVLPEEQQKGYATKLMEFVEAQAREHGVEYIRFDCRARYIELVSFYEHRGYWIKGLLWDEEDNNEPYCLMEKKLT
jgi:GNAT superfamily N-acetyltransferase